MSQRAKIIHEILIDLRRLEKEAVGDADVLYAIHENIRFFEAAKHVVNLLRWQLFHASHIESHRLLELADLSIPKWEMELYKGLCWIERRKFPGLLTPLYKRLTEMPGRILLDVGCGGMEIERQVIDRLLQRDDEVARVFIGVDQSPASFGMIEETFQDYKDRVEVVYATRKSMNKWLKPGTKHRVVFVKADVLQLSEWLAPQEVDVVYSSRLKHHIPIAQRDQLDKALKKIAKVALEYDDYQTALSWLPLVVTAWSRPALLNGALLSRLRQPTKKSLKRAEKAHSIKFFSPPGSYIKTL